MKHLAFCFPICLFFLSCDNELALNIPREDPKLVIESYISTGDSLIVRLNESGPANVNRSYDNKFMSNASVTIEADGTPYQLQYTSAPISTDGWASGFVAQRQGSYYYLPRAIHQVTPGTSYKITVSDAGRTAGAQVVAMAKTTLVNNMLYPLGHVGADTTWGLKIEAQFPSEDSYYECRWYVRGLFHLQDGTIDTTLPVTVRVFTDRFVHRVGESGPIDFDTRQPFSSQTTSSADGFILLMRMSKLQNDFFIALEAQKKDYSLFTEITEIPTNIENGYGIFTSIASDTMTVRVVR